MSQRSPHHRLLPIALAAAALLPAGRATGDIPSGDGVPTGTVAFFAAGTACPEGWGLADKVLGRMVVGVTRGVDVGIEVGTPLVDSEDRAHDHAFTATVTLAYKSVSASDGSNQQGAAAQSYMVVGETAPATSGLPFIQLLACEKQ